MSGTLNETSVSVAAASVLAVSPTDSDEASGIEMSTSADEVLLTVGGPGVGDGVHPNANSTGRLARNRSFMATYPFKSSEKNTIAKIIRSQPNCGKASHRAAE
jgi:hypothetical protein